MHRHDVRDAVQGGRKMAGQVGVPGMRVHDICLGHCRRHGQVGGDGPERGVRVVEVLPRRVRDRAEPVGSLAVHGEADQVSKLARQILHVHAGAAVDLRRVFPGQQRDADLGEHRGHGATCCPLPTTVTPPGETTNPRARSCSLSTPTATPSGTITFLSRMASWTTAFLPIFVLCMRTERSTRDHELTRAPGDSTDLTTRPPETMTPLLTTLLIARPIRSPLSCTNFAGGCDGTYVKIGHWSL